MVELFAGRDRDGQLRIFTSEDVIKNNGKGYWLTKYNSGNVEIASLNKKDEFPEISWDDAKLTRLVLTNPLVSEKNIEDIPLSGTIEVNTPTTSSSYNIKKGTTTVFINDISYIEPQGPENGYRSLIHMKNGDIILCEQSQNAIKHLIRNSEP